MRNCIETCWIYDENIEEFRKDILHFQGQKYILLSLDDEYPEINSPIPGIHLYQNYPNPFNPQVNISFELEETSSIELHIYNVKGQLVKTLVDELYRPGKYTLNWDGRDNNDTKVSSGVYYYRFTTEDNAYNGKMLMLK